MTLSITIIDQAHTSQRYDTVGDWQTKRIHAGPLNDLDEITITVSSLPDARMEALVAIHELCEALICLHHGVSAAEVDAFDLLWSGKGEPGDSPQAPYHAAHQIATRIERIMANALNVDWESYEKAIEALPVHPSKDSKCYWTSFEMSGCGWRIPLPLDFQCRYCPGCSKPVVYPG